MVLVFWVAWSVPVVAGWGKPLFPVGSFMAFCDAGKIVSRFVTKVFKKLSGSGSACCLLAFCVFPAKILHGTKKYSNNPEISIEYICKDIIYVIITCLVVPEEGIAARETGSKAGSRIGRCNGYPVRRLLG